MTACLLCGVEVREEADADLCSACGFLAQRARDLGFALVPEGQQGGCRDCLHASVCRAAFAASDIGALITACAEWTDGEKVEEDIDDDDDDEIRGALLKRCARECPHHEDTGAHPNCVPQGLAQRAAFCSTIRKWSSEEKTQCDT